MPLALSAVLVASAADREEPSARERSREAAERGIKVMSEEYARFDEKYRAKESDLDRQKEELEILDSELKGESVGVGVEMIRIMEQQLMETRVQSSQTEELFSALRGMNRAELKRALPTASPDSLLNLLLERQVQAEQQVAMLSVNHSEDHPERLSVEKLLETINGQIDERLDGIMAGLQVRIESMAKGMAKLETRLQEAKHQAVRRAILIRPVIQAQRDLEFMRMVRERLWTRLEQEKLDLALESTKTR